MLKKLQLKKSTSLIVSLLFLLMLTSIIVVPVLVNGKESPTYSSIMIINDDETSSGEDDDDDDEDGISDHDEEENERSIEIEVDGTEAQIESVFDSGEEENEFDITIHAESDKLLIEIEFSTEVDDTENELEFDVEFTQLIGYNDTDANNIYDSSIDDTIETYNIGEFNDIEYTFQNDTNGELHILSVMSIDNTFGIVAYISNEFILFNDTLLTPTELKFDIIINDFTGDFERVALKTELEFESEVEYDYDDETEDEEYEFADDEVEYEINLNDYKGFFSWSENATTDGVVYPVYLSEIDPLDSEQIFYLNYVAGDQIIHDPKVGIANLLIGIPLGLGFGLFFPELSRSGFLIVTGIVALIAVSGSLFALRRKRN